MRIPDRARASKVTTRVFRPDVAKREPSTNVPRFVPTHVGPGALVVETTRVRATAKRDHEHRAQVMLFQDLVPHEVRRFPILSTLYAIPNYSGRLGTLTAQIGARLKAEGRKKGVPDVVLPVARGAYAHLYIELKIKPNKLSPEQREFATLLRANKSAVAVVSAKDPDECAHLALDVITSYLVHGDHPLFHAPLSPRLKR